MATSDPISWPQLNVSAGFHFETKYILLKYLGLLPVRRSHTPATDQGDAQTEEERTRRLEEELRQLEEDRSALFPSRGSDISPSPVFSLANAEHSVEDRLTTIGDKVTRELGAHLAAAVQTLLSGPLDYQRFRSTTLELSVQTQEGKVLVPLVLLQALQSEGQPLTTLLELGLRYLEEDEANYIIQQGGWCEVLGLGPEDQLVGAEDSNDICIIPEEQPSPPSSLLCTADNGSDQSSWQTESFPVSLAGHESWAQVGAMDPEDVKSLDSNEGVALAEERSENNSSNSDIVHVEREDTELLEEGGDAGATEESMISVLGTESELAELRAEFGDQAPVAPVATGAESTPPASLISLETVAIETPASLYGEPSLLSSEPKLLPPVPPPAEPKPPAPSPVPAVEPEPEPESAAAPALVPSEVEVPVPAKEITSASAEPEATSEPASDAQQEMEPITTPHQPEPEPEPEPEAPVTAPQVLRAPAVEITEAPVEAPAEVAPVALDEAQPGETFVEAPAKEKLVQPEPAAKLQALLYGGAALALLAALSFGLIFIRRR